MNRSVRTDGVARSFYNLTAYLLLAALLVVALASLAYALYRGHDTAIINVSRTAMFNVQEVMAMHYQRHGQFPPAVTTQGGYPHSWRTQVENTLRQQYRNEVLILDEPWDSHTNTSLASRLVPYGGFDLTTRHRRLARVPPTSFFCGDGRRNRVS
jgi:hypothetical protein